MTPMSSVDWVKAVRAYRQCSLKEAHDAYLLDIQEPKRRVAELRCQSDELLAVLKNIRANVRGFDLLTADQAKFKLRVIDNIIYGVIEDMEPKP